MWIWITDKYLLQFDRFWMCLIVCEMLYIRDAYQALHPSPFLTFLIEGIKDQPFVLFVTFCMWIAYCFVLDGLSVG